MEISFRVSPADRRLIDKIIRRSHALYEQHADKDAPAFNRLSATMDIVACHANGCALDLRRLLEADTVNFLHDVTGITLNMDRKTGQLLNHFLPRCAVPQVEMEAA